MRIFHICITSVALLLFFSAPTQGMAQQRQILSVTPPLFQLSALPGDVWQSSIKVVNGNAYPLTVYAEIVNFQATGEAGQGKFIPIINDAEAENATLAEWIEMAKGPHVIDSEETKDLSFFVDIPKDAAPGGHYAAILITTQPPSDTDEAVAVHTSQAVTSLFFVRVEGDVHEDAGIREFRALDTFVEKPEADLSLRFENKGNVHIQPRGDIVITNMWGTPRGTIPVNYQTHFGNVLPRSIRDFKFSWRSDFSITDIGRYKAIATLAYGEDGIKNVTSTAYFWVIPLKATLMTLAALALFITLIIWMVRSYIRRMLALAGVEMTASRSDREPEASALTPHDRIRYRKVSAPIQNGVLDLRTRLHAAEEPKDVLATLAAFVIAYKKFFISLIIIIAMGAVLAAYFKKATEEHDRYQVIIDEGGTETVLDGSEAVSGE